MFSVWKVNVRSTRHYIGSRPGHKGPHPIRYGFSLCPVSAGVAGGVAEHPRGGRRQEQEEAAGRGEGEVHPHLRQDTLQQSR